MADCVGVVREEMTYHIDTIRTTDGLYSVEIFDPDTGVCLHVTARHPRPADAEAEAADWMRRNDAHRPIVTDTDWSRVPGEDDDG